jgi:WD40 repeat protein
MKTTICHFETHLHKLRHYWKSGVSLLGLSLLLLSYVDGFAQSVEAIHIFQGHSDSVESVAFSPDGNKALSGSYDRTMKLWNVETGTLEETFQEHTDFIMSVAFASDDGSDVLSGSADGTFKYWRNGNKTITFALEEPIGLVHSIAFSPDGNYALLSGSRHNTTKLWDIKTGLESITPPTHQAWVHLVAFSPDGNKALSASDDGIIKVWNVKTGEVMHSFSNTDRIWAAAFVPNRNQLLFGGNDGSIRVLDVAGKEIRTLKGHTGRIYSVAVADSQVLSGGHDGSMKLWNLDTGQELSSFQGHSDIVSSIVFSPNGYYALSGSYDKTLKLWGIFDVSTGFQGLKESYLVGDQIVVDLVETGQRSEQMDIWVAIRLHTGELIFITPSSSAQAPFKTSVDSSETTHRLLDIEVTPVIVGKYTLYALYVEKGKNPLEDGLKVRRSNLLVQEVILDKVK